LVTRGAEERTHRPRTTGTLEDPVSARLTDLAVPQQAVAPTTEQAAVPGVPLEPADLRARQMQLLADCDLLDVPEDAELDAITRLASRVTGFPITMINLLETERTCQATSFGIPRTDVGRDTSLCNRASLIGGVVTSQDCTTDLRFADLPWVDGRWAHVRRYGSAPLVIDGLTIGTLCIFDQEPGPALDDTDQENLADLASVVVALLERRRHNRRLEAAREQLRRAATHDELTGLPNRTLLMDRLQVALASAERSGQPAALLFCDLDGFKAVNDTHGHDAGDAVLAATAGRLRAAVRTSDTVARLGGDEFVILCPAAGSAADVEVISRRLRAAVSAPVRAGGLEHRVGISVGSAFSRAGQSAQALLAAADAQMYAAKRRRARVADAGEP
jgi:diguanylate cyclase (GGDEF)-like protein